IYLQPKLLSQALYLLVGLLAHRVIVSSEAVRQLFPGVVRGRVVTIPNGIDLNRFNPDNPKIKEAAGLIRQEFGIPPEAFLVGFVGRFIPWKGAKEFVKACDLAGQDPALDGAHFMAVGSSLLGYEAYLEEVQAIAQQSNLKERFHFATNRQDIPAFLSAFDLFVHASTKAEPFGIVIIEALAMGKPVIATAGGGVLEILEDSYNGKLVQPGSVEALAKAILELTNCPKQRQNLEMAARQTATARFNIQRATTSQEKVYMELFSPPTVNQHLPKVFSQPQPSPSALDLSVIIVNYNGQPYVIEGLNALRAGLEGVTAEIFIVDNASTDSSLGAVKRWLENLPEGERGNYTLLENRRNLGYAKANNQAIRQSRGKVVLLLNPDAAVKPDTIGLMLEFMHQHPQVGISGPRILLPNGQLDRPCRRSFKTPSIYLYKFLGLSKLFPKSRHFGKYYLSYLDENLTTEVDAVIGAFLMIRRKTIAEIGLLDEHYFIYCEDEDWCFQAKKQGWQVYYYPPAVVQHQKGASTNQRKFRMIWEWHKSVFKFHRKNLAPSYPLPVNLLIYVGIALQLSLTLLLNLMRQLIKMVGSLH
ncbi:MAG: glycosyltransferase, partial [Chloroflexota bacterium]